MRTFGDRLRDARARAELTQDLLSEKVGVTKASVSSWENNRDTPQFKHLAPLQAALDGISLDWLICGATSPELRIAEAQVHYGQGDRPRVDGYVITDPVMREVFDEIKALSHKQLQGLLTLLRSSLFGK